MVNSVQICRRVPPGNRKTAVHRASTFQKRNILQSDRMAGLLVEVLFDYRHRNEYLLHEFAVMPDHFHLLITPGNALERAKPGSIKGDVK